MKRIHKKIISALLPLPLFLAISFCCCVEENAFADEHHSNFSVVRQGSHELEKIDRSEHRHHHSDGDHECACPKHLSFLSEQPVNIVFDSTVSQILAKNFLTSLRLDDVIFLAPLTNHSQGPPQDRLDHVSLPIYLKVSNLRI